MRPTITIITVVFNGARTIESTVKSVLSQTYRPIQYLIMDGGSTDGTLKTLEQYPAIEWYSEPDNGIYDAMNKGILRARGDWIYFLGADDTLWNEQVLERLFLTPTNCHFLYGNVFSVGMKKIYGGEFSMKRLLLRNMSHQAVFYRREVFDLIGNYNLRYKLFADWDFHIRCFFNPNIARQHVNQTIANFAADGVSSQKEDILFLEEVIIPLNLTQLAQDGTGQLRSIKLYDACWRLLRSIDKKSEQDFVQFFQTSQGAILRMVNTQHLISRHWLRNGFVSKTIMTCTYLQSLFYGELKSK